MHFVKTDTCINYERKAWGLESSFKASTWAVSGGYSKSAAWVGDVPPTRASYTGARHQDRSKARPTDVARGEARRGGQEIGNGMLRNPCSLSPVQASSRSHHISETVQTAHSPTSFLVPGPSPECAGDRKHVRCCLCSQEQTGCAACRRGIQSVSGGITVTSLLGRPRCLASPHSDILRGDHTIPSHPGGHVAGYPRAPSKHVPSTSNCKYL